MSRRRRKPTINVGIQKIPKRGEIWHVIDRDKNHSGKEEDKIFESSVQGGTRFCIIVSNDIGNLHSPVVEVVYTTTAKKNNLPTHFGTKSTPEPSTVLCEQIMSVAKKDLTEHCGTLTMNEKKQLDRCLRVSLGL